MGHRRIEGMKIGRRRRRGVSIHLEGLESRQLLASGTIITATAGTPFLGVDAQSAPEPVYMGSNLAGESATVDWGDGTALGGTTKVQPDGDPITSVFGTHTFARDGTYNGSVTLHDPNGNFFFAPLTSVVSPIVPIMDIGYLSAATTGTAGTPTQISPMQFKASGANAPAPDPSYYSATVSWGDGSPTSAATVLASDAGLEVIPGPHIFAAPGIYEVSYTLGDAGAPGLARGSIPVTIGSLTGSPIAPPSGDVILPLPPAINGLVPLERVAGQPAPLGGYYSATIDYGDGSPTRVGTIVEDPQNLGGLTFNPSAAGSFTVYGPQHTYASSGYYQVHILIGTTGQPNLTKFTNSVFIPPVTPSVVGALNPASDSGISNTDGVTNVNTPNFMGTTTPGAIVKLYATPTAAPGSTPIQVGQGVADASGAYSITTSLLADGSYDISAIAIADANSLSPPTPIESGSHPLVIDTVGPRVVGFAVTDAARGQFQVAFQDERSGLVAAQLVDGANYHVRRSTPAPRPGQDFLVSSLVATPLDSPTAPVTVTGSVFNGHYLVLRGGIFDFTIAAGGITDVAGNALDGEFYGKFPTGDGHPGGDFRARVSIKGYVPSGPTPSTTASPIEPGVPQVSPGSLAPRLKKPGLNAPPTSATIHPTAAHAKAKHSALAPRKS